MRRRFVFLFGFIILFIVSLFMGCVTTVNYDKDIKNINSKLVRLDYYLSHDRCFTTYNKCMIEKKSKCWSQHEKCVIAVYNMYKPLLD